MHPYCPFITEEIWSHFNKNEMLINAAWPKLNDNRIDNKTACLDFWDDCDDDYDECMNLSSNDVWLEWDDENMGDNQWNDEEEYEDSNFNGQFRSIQRFTQLGL